MKTARILNALTRMVQVIEMVFLILVTIGGILVCGMVSPTSNMSDSVAHITSPMPDLSTPVAQQLFSFFIYIFACFWIFWLTIVGVLSFGISLKCHRLLYTWIIFNSTLKLQFCYLAFAYLYSHTGTGTGTVDGVSCSWLMVGFVLYNLVAILIVLFSARLISVSKKNAQEFDRYDREKALHTV